MYFKVYKNFDQINVDLMTISDLLHKYKILMYPKFWPIIFIYLFFPPHTHIATFFHIWAPAPEELSARPCSGATEHALFYGLKIKE